MMLARANSIYKPTDHFADVSKMIDRGSGSQRKIDNYKVMA